MSPQPVLLPRSLVNQLLHQAQSRPDFEVCGLVGAHQGHPTHVYPVTNAATDPRRHFRMDPQGQIEAMKSLRERNETLFAIYHSHPHTDAFPSDEDLEWAAYPEALYLIISLNTKGVLEMRGFRLVDSRIEEIPLAMEEKA
ncbi:MAG: CysO-cysteine peptidase [Methylohalobius crimeensis]